MNRIQLVHLSYASVGLPTETVEFSDRLTVIHGASDTGKSYIVDAIDYLLGAKGIRDIPEAHTYSHYLLGLRVSHDRIVTLIRDATSNYVWVHEGDLRSVPTTMPGTRLGTKHSATSESNISRFLLRAIDMDGRKAQKNQAGATVSISFRNISNLSIVDETKMQATASPVLNDIPTAWTADKSIFRVLLTGEDDSHLSAPAPAREVQVSKGKTEVFDRILEELTRSVADDPDKAQLLDQRARLATTVTTIEATLAGKRLMRDQISTERARVYDRRIALQGGLSEIRELIARLDLLQEQYSSDLARLDMVREAGSLLGFYESDVCPFCGAALEHQDRSDHPEGEAQAFLLSIENEVESIRRLQTDLTLTLDDLETQRRSQAHLIELATAELEISQARLIEAEIALEPIQHDFREASNAIARVARAISIHDQISAIESLRSELIAVGAPASAPTTQQIELSASRDFAETVKQILARWKVPEAASIYLDESTTELVVGGRKRESRGKGMRAILHAAFTVGLAQYCLENDLPHTGFVVLDSPVVTYREPDNDELPNGSSPGPGAGEVVGEDIVSHSVADAFYLYLQDEFLGQAVVIENVRPPVGLSDGTANIKFSKNRSAGRYGFLPPLDELHAEDFVSGS